MHATTRTLLRYTRRYAFPRNGGQCATLGRSVRPAIGGFLGENTRLPLYAAPRRWTSSTAGDELFQEYVDLTKELNQLRQKKEIEKSQAMAEAFRQAEEKNQKNKKSQGVAVVKTLAKETRKELRDSHEPERELMEKAQKKLEEAAFQHNHPFALVQLGNQALAAASKDPAHAEQHIRNALDLYKRGGENGFKDGWFNHGHLLWTGFPSQEEGEETDEPVVMKPQRGEALQSFEKAVNMGDIDAMYFLGVHLLSQIDPKEKRVNENDELLEICRRGLRLVQDAADAGHNGALHYLALFYLNGHLALRIRRCAPHEFVSRLDKAVDAGNQDALFLRGYSYYYGQSGYPCDYRRALEDFLKAADLGHADAAVSAGAMLHSGEHVPRDQEKAFELYQHAGELGSPEGWRNVAACYATGEGVAQSIEMSKHITNTMGLADLSDTSWKDTV